jgi:hypothetical protein
LIAEVIKGKLEAASREFTTRVHDILPLPPGISPIAVNTNIYPGNAGKSTSVPIKITKYGTSVKEFRFIEYKVTNIRVSFVFFYIIILFITSGKSNATDIYTTVNYA